MSKTRQWLVVMLLSLAILLLGSLHTPSRAYIHGLSGYADAAAVDPFFALPGTDTEALSLSVYEFEKTLATALPSFSEIGAQPYPVEFLKTLSKAEVARRRLIESPTKEHATTYHALLTDVFAAYTHDVSRLMSYLDTPNAAERTQYGFLSGETTRQYIQQVLSSNLAKAAVYAAQEDRRFACITTPAISCTLEKHALLSSARPTVSHPPIQINAVRDALRDYESVVRRGESTTVELIASACYPSEQPMLYDVASTTSRLSGKSMVWLRPLNDLYFYDLASTTRPTLLTLREAGARYEYQPLHAYLCPDFGNEVSRASTVLYAHSLLMNRPITGTQPALAAVLQAQQAFLEQAPASEYLFKQVAVAADTLLTHYDRTFLTAELGEERVRRLQELVLLARTNTAHFERTVGYFDDFQVGNAVFFFDHGGPIADFLVTRGGLSSLLLMFNETAATPPATSLLSEKSLTTVAVPEILSYWNDLSTNVPLSELSVLLHESARAHAEAYGPRIEALIARRRTSP